MKNRFILTITDVRGTKSYNLHAVIKQAFYHSLLFILTILILGGLTIGSLNRDMNNLEKKKENIKSEFSSLEKDNIALTKKITQKSSELEELNMKIENIEEIVGLKEDKDMTYNERVDLAKVTSAQKQYMLQNIPSGYPLAYSGTTAPFGMRMHPILHKKAFHPGIDLRAKMNTQIRVTANGVIEYAGYSKGSGYGNLVIVHHGFGFKTYYGHLNKVSIKSGSVVRKGDLIGYSGNTGLSSGPHLHYEIRFIQRPMNPSNFIKWNMRNYDKIFKNERRIKWQSLIKLAKHQTELMAQQLSPNVQALKGK